MIKFNDDHWSVRANNPTIEDYYTFDFSYIKPLSLKNQVKKYIFISLKNNNLSYGTIHRYSYNFKHFLQFLNETNYEINYFSQLTAFIIDQYIFYLKNNMKSVRTMIVAYSALRSIVKFGQLYEEKNYPKSEIFPNEVTRLFSVEDTLITKQISDHVISQINMHIKSEKNILFKSALLIARDTGLRLSEILSIKENCIMEDFAGLPILFTFSYKNNNERALPISNELASTIKELEVYTQKLRQDFGVEELFVYLNKWNKLQTYKQVSARIDLKSFIHNFNITEESGEYSKFTFHSFRHTLGTDMLNNGQSPFEVKSYLGHMSLHSTGIYAKLSDVTVQQEYEKLGFIGIREISVNEVCKDAEGIIAQQRFISGSLPDGVCKKAFEGDNHCNKFNMCLLCNKFQTFVKDLPTHIAHLERIREDRQTYIDEMGISNLAYLEKIEGALVTIIERLEEIKYGIK